MMDNVGQLRRGQDDALGQGRNGRSPDYGRNGDGHAVDQLREEGRPGDGLGNSKSGKARNREMSLAGHRRRVPGGRALEREGRNDKTYRQHGRY